MSGESKRLPAAAYVGAIVAAIAGAVIGVAANLSEGNLVALGYLLVPLAVFGIVGLSAERRLNLALVYAGLAFVAFLSFMVLIFPSL